MSLCRLEIEGHLTKPNKCDLNIDEIALLLHLNFQCVYIVPGMSFRMDGLEKIYVAAHLRVAMYNKLCGKESCN